MQSLLTKFENSTYRPHSKYKNIGQFCYKGENVVIKKNDNGTYIVIRQHKIGQQKLEQIEYTDLNQISEEMSKDEYGWARNTYRPADVPRKFSMRDIMFYNTK